VRFLAQDRPDHEGTAMADESALRFVGFGFGAITAAVALVAVLLIAQADRSAIEQGPTTAVATAAQ
jgi:hypothetical protein